MTAKAMPFSELPELEVVKLAQAEDEQAFVFLHNKHRRIVLLICMRMVKNYAIAEELTQEVFHKLMEKNGRRLKTFKGRSAFKTWLCRVAINEAYMHLRKKRLQMIPLHDLLGHPTSSPTNPSSVTVQPSNNFNNGALFEKNREADVGHPDHTITSFADRELVNKLLEAVPEGQRETIILHDYFGFEYHEIAKMFGYTTSNAKSQRHKGIEHMLLKFAKIHNVEVGKKPSMEKLRGLLRPLVLDHQAA